MENVTYRKWTRDALETKHQLKHESDDKSLLVKQYANRVVALIEELRTLKVTYNIKE